MTQYRNDSMTQSLWLWHGQPLPDALGDFLVDQIVVQDVESRVPAQIQQACLPLLVGRLQVPHRFFLPAGGTIFQFTTAGKYTVLFSFTGGNAPSGSFPNTILAQDTNGLFYGVTAVGGGPDSDGTFYDLNNGLAPFVSLQTASGKIGAQVGILGQGFSSSSVVKFGGVHASTIVLTGRTFITATVPTGALTGSVTVTTGSTTLTSRQAFKVLPTITGFTPPSGPVGTSVTIAGTGLAQTTKVAFGSKAATFTVNSDTRVTATVPAGAITATISATTKGGAAVSKTKFTVN
jgi:IPT/TIG domain